MRYKPTIYLPLLTQASTPHPAEYLAKALRE